MATIAAPFEIGQLWWAPRMYPEQRKVPCPVCFGQLTVTVILGAGERIGVPCDACGIGYDGPRGTIDEWDYSPGVESFVIAGVASMHNNNWTVLSETGDSRSFRDLRSTEAEAMAESVKQCATQYERNMQSRQQKRHGTQKASWSIRYHRKCIADLQRQIAWHEGRLLKPREESKSVDAVDPSVPPRESGPRA